MTALYIWIFFLSVSGTIGSFFLVPSDEEEASYQLKAQKYSKADEFYRKQYEMGVRSLDTIARYTTLRENEGKIPDAIAAMQAYVDHFPNDFYALRRLADLYRLNQQYEEYYQTLLKLQAIKVDWEVLQELAMWYRNTGEKNQLLGVLKQLIPTGHGDDSDYFDLADLLASEKNYQDAYNLLISRREYFVDKISISDMLFELWLSDRLSQTEGNNEEEMQKSIHALASYLLDLKKNKITYYAMGVVQENYPKYALELLDLLQPQIDNDPYLGVFVMQIWWEHPETKQKVVPLLEKVLASKYHSPQLQNFAFTVFIDRNNDTQLLNLINTTDPKTIEDTQIVDVSIAAITNHKPELAKAMQKVLGENYLNDHTRLAVFLSVGAQEPNAQEKLEDFLNSGLAIPSDYYSLFKLAMAANYEKNALEIGQRLPPYKGLLEYQFVDIVQSYVQLKKGEELYSLIKKSIPPLAPTNAALPLALLDVSFHESYKVAHWLRAQKTVKENILNAFFTVAETSEEYPFALMVAKRIAAEYPSAVAEANYGLTLVQLGKFKNGFELLRPIYEKNQSNRQVERIYFTALSFTAKRDPSYHEELFAFMQEREKRGNVPIELLRDFQYAYLDILHDFTNAKRIVFFFAENGQPQGNDVQTLLYLWGPKLNSEQLAWLDKRAVHSGAKDLAYWMQDLIFVGHSERAAYLFESRFNEGLDVEAYMAYLDALTSLQRHAEMRKTIDMTFPMLHDRKQFERIAGYAEESIYAEARTLAWIKILELDPKDPIAWQKLAKAAFDGHDYTLTLNALDQFFVLDRLSNKMNPKIYESYYEYAEALKRKRIYMPVNYYYTLALNHIAVAEEPTIQMLEVEALIYFELGKVKSALSVLSEAYRKSSRDTEVGSSFATMMISEGLLSPARRFLKTLYRPTKANNEMCLTTPGSEG